MDQVAGPDAAEVLRDVGEGRAAGGRRLPRDGHFGAGGGQRRGGLHPRHDQSRATLRPEAPLQCKPLAPAQRRLLGDSGLGEGVVKGGELGVEALDLEELFGLFGEPQGLGERRGAQG